MLMLFASCAPTAIQQTAPQQNTQKPSIAYPAPGVFQVNGQKYKQLKLGILKFSDRRPVVFYDTDHYFREDITSVFSSALASEMRAAGLFRQISELKGGTPSLMTAGELALLTTGSDVDVVLAADIVEFNMFRNKLQSGYYTIMVEVGIVPQLIHKDSGVVLWSGYINRSEKTFAKSGALTPGFIGKMTVKAMGQTINDMMKLMMAEGLKVVQR